MNLKTNQPTNQQLSLLLLPLLLILLLLRLERPQRSEKGI